MPNGAVIWFLSERVQASLDTNWQVPTENHATHYRSGNSVDGDYAVDVGPIPSRPKLFFGLQGYVFQQFTPDKLDGVTYENGSEGRVLAIGPQIRHDLFHGGIAQNHTKGDKLWLQFALPIWTRPGWQRVGPACTVSRRRPDRPAAIEGPAACPGYADG